MAIRKDIYKNKKLVLDKLNEVVEKADDLHRDEKFLIQLLYDIDQGNYYVMFGYNSLMGFCNHALRFSKTQSQRITTQVRRFEPTSNLEKKDSK